MALGTGYKSYNTEPDTIKLYPTDRPEEQWKKMHVVEAVGQQPVPEPRFVQNGIQKNLLGPENTVTTCQFCYASIKTAVKYTVTSRTHIAAAVCSMICCCCIPYGSESAKNSDHYCPACQRYLGTYEK